jgi:hypothetical protein
MQEPKAKFLVYRQGAVPTGITNWLLDLELAYGVFTADRASLLRHDLGLKDEGTEPRAFSPYDVLPIRQTY